jgi:hypothetical protein
VQVDPVFEGVTGGPGSLIKYNPLSNMTSAEVWNFLRVMVRRLTAGYKHTCWLPTLAGRHGRLRAHGTRCLAGRWRAPCPVRGGRSR